MTSPPIEALESIYFHHKDKGCKIRNIALTRNKYTITVAKCFTHDKIICTGNNEPKADDLLLIGYKPSKERKCGWEFGHHYD